MKAEELMVKREDVKKAIEQLVDGGDEGEERRKKAKKLEEIAKGAVENGGSSYLNVTLLIENVNQQAKIVALLLQFTFTVPSTRIAMGSLSDQLHFVLFPFMAQGHLIPMVDIGRLLAQRDVIFTIVTTPQNVGRVHESVARAMESGHRIRLLQLQFPGKEVGLPEGYENLDMLASTKDFLKFIKAANMTEEAGQKLFEKLTPRPNCIISDMCLFYTSKIASNFQVPRISFHGFCLPEKVELTKVQLPFNKDESWKEVFERMAEADQASYGVVINTFEELESSYVKEYRKVRKDKAWCIGPVSLSHKDELDKAQRGNKASINERQCLKWLDSQEPSSVIYACLGSIGSLSSPQLIELGLGLEASNKPFIWVLRGNDIAKRVEKWIKEDGFEERTKGRGLVILGWAPQVLILSHPSIGGFLTHCGWNSTIEGISAGVPLITWPLFADQFSNEKLVVQILKIGVSLGVEKPTVLGMEENSEVILKNEDVKNAVEKLMDEGNEGIERRKRAKEFGEKAKKAVEVGGSSYLNMTLLIQDISQQSSKMCWDLGPSSTSHGHLIPMVDMGRLLAQHSVTVTIATTPLNAVRFKSIIDRDITYGIQIRLLQLRFRCNAAGLPEGCENVHALPSRLLSRILWMLACCSSHLSSP
ncbi:hypothetical protein CRYUN_Cryun16bG0111500 [Craigia yunnanensis]